MRSLPIHDRIAAELNQRRESGLLRSLPPAAPHALIDLSTNSYLALHCNPAVQRQAQELAAGNFCGNLASRLIANRSPLYAELEAEIAAWKRTEAALVFVSGYAANVGVLQALCTRDTAVFSDRLNHASIVDGIRLSGARMIRYRHGDPADLRRRLADCSAREKLIATDAVFSMDGDCAPLADICELARRFGAMVMVDEAHAAGILGARQSGLAEAAGVESDIDIRVGTLSKAVAGLGGFFAGASMLRDYLVNHARSLIYSTGLPHAALAHDVAAVRYIRATPGLGARLLQTAAGFRCRMQELGFDTGTSATQIIPLITGAVEKAGALARALAAAGVRAPLIRPPAVPQHTARVRLSLHLGLTESDLESAHAALSTWKRCT